MRTLKYAIAVIAMGFGGIASAQDAAPSWSLHGFGDVAFKNDYVTPRGLVVTTAGATAQILNGLVFVSPGGIAITVGAWADFNPGYGHGNTTALNEFDYFVGISGNVTDRLKLGVQYVQFISGQPSVAFKDEYNIEFSANYSDGAPGDTFTINPYAKLFWAVDGDSTVVLGKKGGTFDVELGAVPTYKGKGFTLTAPTWITVGPETYWGTGANKAGNVGVLTTGLKLSTPLSFIKGGAGANVYAQVQYYNLINDNLARAKAILNRGANERDHVVFGIGLGYGF